MNVGNEGGGITGWFTSTVSATWNAVKGTVWGSSVASTDIEKYLKEAGVKEHHPIFYRTVKPHKDLDQMTYEELRDHLIETLNAQQEKMEGAAVTSADYLRCAAINISVACLASDDLPKLMRNYQNLSHLFVEYPFQMLVGKWLDEQEVEPDALLMEAMTVEAPDEDCLKELNPPAESVGDIIKAFEPIAKKYCKNEDDDRPDTRVFASRFADEFLRKNRLDLFIDLYQNSKWLSAVLPHSWVAVIQKSIAQNNQLESVISEKKAVLDKDHTFLAEDTTVPVRQAGMRQKDSALLETAKQAVREERSACQYDDDPSHYHTTQQLMKLLDAGSWQALVTEAKKHDDWLKPETITKLEALLEDGTLAIERQYSNKILEIRILIAYQTALAKGQSEEFFQRCQPDPCPMDHWTRILQRGDYEMFWDQLILELYKGQGQNGEAGAFEKLDEIVTEFMPPKLELS